MQEHSSHPGARITGDEVFADVRPLSGSLDPEVRDRCLAQLQMANPELFGLLQQHRDLETLRDGVYDLVERAERAVFSLENDLHLLEKATVRECARVMRSIIAPTNEARTGVSALRTIWFLAQGRHGALETPVTEAFLVDLLHLVQGLAGCSGIYDGNGGARRGVPEFLRLSGREAARRRTQLLDAMAAGVERAFDRYPTGLDATVVDLRLKNRERILEYFGATEEDWESWGWHVQHVIKDPDVMAQLVELEPGQVQAIRCAVENHIPFGVTPYYLSLMDPSPTAADAAVRAQVIPPLDYVECMTARKGERATAFDFMGEQDTSPVDLITRRYPQIAILKPFSTCAQICVYCQRNWEIEECLAPNAMAAPERIEHALEWLQAHPSVREVLVTGGDPALLADRRIEEVFEALATLPHVCRIRFGTRTPVVLPQRWTAELADTLARFSMPGRREVVVVTHFMHPYEVTPEATSAVLQLVQRGIRVYNQAVFTTQNCRRFETAKLRRVLRSINVDPYYTFNLKGKEETSSLRVPVARILQEAKEEARLLPGLDRTDEPVFNLPRLGKNHLRSWQNHRVVMIRPDGARVYEFHPWEKNLTAVPPYNFIDVPILDYLRRLEALGEDLDEYRTIWYYY